jgi:hypothetical protein
VNGINRLSCRQQWTASLATTVLRAGDECGKPEVTAHAPEDPGALTDVVKQLMNITGVSCVALVVIDPTGDGSYSVAGSLEVQLPMPDVLKKVAVALRTQLAASMQ